MSGLLTLSTGAAFTTTTVYDRGVPGLVRVTFQLTSLVLDTEVAGTGAGQVSLNLAVTHSMDGVTYTAVSPLSSFTTPDGITVGPQHDALYAVGRFTKAVASVWRNAALYAAARQPRIVGDLRITPTG
jgi:hypothetical protein